ncbi:MAG: peptidase M14 [Kiritimatiellae bacterium]|nr:peptidase M14 [Kiritimatiellia bacterium]
MPLQFINTAFENASPANWHIEDDGKAATVELFYDHERDAPNRAAGHWHLRLEGEPGTAARITLKNFDNVWNGKHGSPISGKTGCFVSTDGTQWRHIPARKTEDNTLEIDVTLDAGQLYLARIEPYRISDLENLLAEICDHPLVEIKTIGNTVEGRELELVRVGREQTPNRVFLRARAHPWETGGSYCVQGLIRSLLRDDADAKRYLETYSVCVLPMACKDGVARGYTRFNVAGMDLNRKWAAPADPRLAPENHALETWFDEMIDSGRPIQLAIDLHNDEGGKLHVSRPEENEGPYLADMDRFERSLTEHTWFTEGRTPLEFRNPGSFGSAMWTRYRVSGCVLELNCNWIAGLNKPPFGKDWERLGEQMRDVFLQYFADATPSLR